MFCIQYPEFGMMYPFPCILYPLSCECESLYLSILAVSLYSVFFVSYIPVYCILYPVSCIETKKGFVKFIKDIFYLFREVIANHDGATVIIFTQFI